MILVAGRLKDAPQGVAGVVFGPGGSSGESQISKTEPWAAQQPYLTFGFDQARKIYDSGSPQYFPGQTLAGIDPAQTQAINATEQRAMAGNPLLPAAQGQAYDTLGGGYLSAGNPYLQGALNPAFDAVQNRVSSQFEGMGRFGSGAHAHALASALSDTAGQLAYQNYGDERNRQLQTMGMAPGLAAADYNDFAQLGQAGDARRSLEQGLIDDDVARYNYNQNLPNNRLANYLQMIQGNYGNTNTMTQPTQQGSLGAGLAGGALTGASTGAMFGPWGAGIGAIGGGLLGAMSR